MNARVTLFFIVASFIIIGCSLKDEYTTLKNDQISEEFAAIEQKSPSLSIELSDEATAAMERGEFAVPQGYTLERAFPEDTEFEARHRDFGLHRIYNETIDESISSTKAGEDLLCIPGVLHAEPYPEA